MKKLGRILFVSALLCLLAACSSGSASSSSSASTQSPRESLPGQSQSTAASEASDVILPEDGYAEGRMGDTMRTYFFDYTVSGAYVCAEFEGYQPQEGNELLVITATVKNTTRQSIEMYDTDFQAQWGDTGDDDYSLPITFDRVNQVDLPTLRDDQLPSTYTLAVNESRTGLLVYEVPAGKADFSLSTMEYFSDGTTGDTFFVYFTADTQAAV